MSRIFTIWIDNDACPQRIREVVFKAADRMNLPIHVVANSYMKLPGVAKITIVGSEFDAADNYIAEHVQANDLVITADIPLADRVVTAGAVAVSPKGEIFDASSVKEKLAFRNLSQELRSGGSLTGGPPPFSDKDLKNFAMAFDKSLQKLSKQKFIERSAFNSILISLFYFGRLSQRPRPGARSPGYIPVSAFTILARIQLARMPHLAWNLAQQFPAIYEN